MKAKTEDLVRGIDQVTKRREMIARKKHWQAEREKEVFDYVSKYDSNPIHETHTVPQPFNLSKVK
mgnify:CR=1 FL=1